MSDSEFKQSVGDLLIASESLALLLEQIVKEGRAMDREVNWRWVEQALKNVRTYGQELKDGVRTKVPVTVYHAADSFRGMRKYFADDSVEWSKFEQQLEDQVSETTAAAGKVARAINPLDARNVAEIHQALEAFSGKPS